MRKLRNLAVVGMLLGCGTFGFVKYREHAIERDYKARMARELAAQQEAGRKRAQERSDEHSKRLREWEARKNSPENIALQAEIDRRLEALEARKVRARK